MAGGRPLSAAPTRVGNRWRVELPVAPGSAKRRRRTFATKKQAEEYLNEALRAWDGGTPAPPPDPAPAGRRSQAAAAPAAPAPSAAPAAGEASEQAGVATFAEVAAAWHTSRYFKSHRGQPERAADVAALIANHLHTFMDAHGFADGSDLTGEAYEDFLVDVAYGPTDDEDDGGDVDGTGQEAPPVPGDEQCLTVAEAAARTGAGKSTIQRRIDAGAFPHARLVGGKRLIPLGDLRAAGLLDGVPLRPGRPRGDGGFSAGTVGDVRWVLDAILARGVASHGWVLTFDPAAFDTPAQLDPTRPRRHVTVADTARLAGHLHPVHQLVLWLMRGLSLRLGEAYGITLADIVDDGDGPAYVTIRSQGGRIFKVSDGRARTHTATSKNRLKTRGGVRTLVLPRPLADLIATVIDVFHTQPDGSIRSEARLVPGLVVEDAGGQASFRAAFTRAGTIEGIDVAADRGPALLPIPKDMRAGTVTDLAWAGADALAARRWTGHVAGDDVHSRSYILDHADARTLAPVADIITALLDEAAPNGLIIPTTYSCTTGYQPVLHARRRYLDAALADAGWTGTGAHVYGVATMTVADASRLLDVHETTLRGWARAGRFGDTARTAVGTYALPVHAVLAEQERLGNRRTLSAVSAELGLPYASAHQWLRTSNIAIDTDDDGTLVLDDAATAALTAHVKILADLYARAMSVTAAAAHLGLPPAAVEGLIVDGTLTVDAQRGPRNSRYLTRTSLDDYEETRSRRLVPGGRRRWTPATGPAVRRRRA